MSVAAARAAAAKAKEQAAAAGELAADQKTDEQGRKWHLPKLT